MKKTLFIILCLSILIFLRLCGNHKLYFSKKYNIYLLTGEINDSIGKIQIGKSLFHIDNEIKFFHAGDLPAFRFIPVRDTIYIYDKDKNVISFSGKSLRVKKIEYIPTDSAFIDGEEHYFNYMYVDSTSLKKNNLNVWIESNLFPNSFYGEEKAYNVFFRYY